VNTRRYEKEHDCKLEQCVVRKDLRITKDIFDYVIEKYSIDNAHLVGLGETTLSEKFTEMLEWLNDRNMPYHITTNAVGHNYPWAEKLKPELAFVMMSLHDDKDNSRYVAKLKKRLHELKIPHFVTFVLSNSNGEFWKEFDRKCPSCYGLLYNFFDPPTEEAVKDIMDSSIGPKIWYKETRNMYVPDTGACEHVLDDIGIWHNSEGHLEIVKFGRHENVVLETIEVAKFARKSSTEEKQ